MLSNIRRSLFFFLLFFVIGNRWGDKKLVEKIKEIYRTTFNNVISSTRACTSHTHLLFTPEMKTFSLSVVILRDSFYCTYSSINEVAIILVIFISIVIIISSRIFSSSFFSSSSRVFFSSFSFLCFILVLQS